MACMHDTQEVARESLSRVSCEFRQFRNQIHTRLEITSDFVRP